MTESYRKTAEELGVWAEDHRSMEGQQALYSLNPFQRKGLFESPDFIEDQDPRVVATKRAIEEARRPERLLMPGGYQVKPMQEGREYKV